MEYKGDTREESDSKSMSHLRAAPKLGPFDNKSSWGESSVESLDSLGSIDSHTKLSPLSSKPSRISEIIRTNSLSPVQEGPAHIVPNISTPVPNKPNLGELKPPMRHHHKNLLSGSGSSPNEKSPSHLNLGPIVSHNHPNGHTANLSPNATNHISPGSPQYSPGQITSPRLNKSSPNKEDSSISPNQSFNFGSPLPLGNKPKFDVPPLGVIAPAGRQINTNHSNAAGSAELTGAAPPSTAELGPLSSGRGVPSPRIPLGASPLQPLGAIRTTASAPASAALQPVHEEPKTASPEEENHQLEVVETASASAEQAAEQDSQHAELSEPAAVEIAPAHADVESAVENTESSASAAHNRPLLTAVLHEVSVITVEAPVIHIVESSVAEPPTLHICSPEPATSEETLSIEQPVLRMELTDAVEHSKGGAEAASQEAHSAEIALGNEAAESKLVELVPAVEETVSEAPVEEIASSHFQPSTGVERVLRMETPPQSPRQAPRQVQATPLAALHIAPDVHEILNPAANTEETTIIAESVASETPPPASETERDRSSYEIPPPNTPVRGSAGGGSKMSRFSRTPASGGRSLIVAPLVLGEASAPAVNGAMNSGKVLASDSAPPSTPSAHSPHSHSHSPPAVPGTPTLSPRSHGPSHASTPHTPSHAHFFKGRSASNLSVAGSTGSSVERLHLHAHPPIQPLAAHKYEMSYNKAASDLRAALLHLDADESNSKLMVRNIFRKLDVNEHGELTAQELKNFVLSPELGLFEVDDPRALKYATLLMEQIDINGDGSVSLSELETFLWPPHMNAEKSAGPGIYSAASADFKEVGMILDFARTAVRYHVSSVAALGSAEAILQEFAKLAKASLKRGCLDTKLVKRAFLNLKIPEFGRYLTQPEVDQLVVTLDCNDDGVVSAREFKEWLFPAHKQEDLNSLSNYLKKLIAEHFQGDVWHMYRFFCNGSDQLYKNDFGIVLKTLDGSISRHEAQAMAHRIAGNDKAITMANLLSVLGLVGRTTLTAADGFSIHHSGSTDADSTINTGSVASGRSANKRHRRTSIGSGRKLSTHEEEVGFNESMEFAEREDDQEQQVNDNESVGSLSDASELSCDSTGMDGTDGLGVSDAAVRADGGGSGAGHSRTAVVDKNAPSETEKAVIRDLLFRTSASSGSHSPPARSSQLNASGLFNSHHNNSLHHSLDFAAEITEASEQKGVRKTVGLVPEQLVALGYAEHLGRWRGFPYDNWSCCETNLLECPVISPRQSFGSPGSSPNKNRLSLDSSGSLHQRTKSPPFRPAGASPTKATPVVVELRETAPLAAPAVRRRSPQRSPARATVHTSAAGRASPPVRKLASAASAPRQPTSGISTGHGVHKSVASTSGVAAPSAPAIHRKVVPNTSRSRSPAKVPTVDFRTFAGEKFREAKKNRVQASSKPAAPAPASYVKSAEPKPHTAANTSNKSTLKKRTSSPAPAKPVPDKQQLPFTAPPTTAAASVAATPAPAQAALSTPSEAEVPAEQERSDQCEPVEHAEPPADHAQVVVAEANADVTGAADVHTDVPLKVDQEHPPVPADAQSSPTARPPGPPEPPEPPEPPTATKAGPPKVHASYQSPLQRPSVKGPPVTAKFTVKVPVPAPPSVAPEVSELFNRLRQPDVTVEAQQVRLQVPPPKWSADPASTRKPVKVAEDRQEPGKRCASPIAHDIADLVECASMSGSQAFEATLQSLHSELDAVRRQSIDQELSFTALIDSNRHKLSTLQKSFESANEFNFSHDHDADAFAASSDESDGEENIEFRDPCEKLQVTGSSLRSRRGKSRAAVEADYAEANKSALAITLGPLDAPFLPNAAHSPNKYRRRVAHSDAGDRTRRSHSAPARRYHNTSNSDWCFFSGSFSQLLTSPPPAVSGAMSAVSKPRARSASPHRGRALSAVNTSALTGGSTSVHIASTYKAAHDKGIWVPSSPLHGESFNRIRKQKWRKKDPAMLAKSLEAAQRRAQSRSPSPARAVREQFSFSERRPQSPAPQPAKVVVNGVEKLSPRPANRVTAAPIRRTEAPNTGNRRPASPAAQRKILSTSRQERTASPQYSAESKQSPLRRGGGRVSPANGTLPDQVNPDRAQYSQLFEPMQSAFPPVPPSPPSMLPYQSVPFGGQLPYAPIGYGVSPMPLHPLQLHSPPAYFPPSPGYTVPLSQSLTGYPGGSYAATSQLGLPGLPGLLYSAPSYTQHAPYEYTVPTAALSMQSTTPGFVASLGGATNDAWWVAIQAQKRQNEQMAFESELTARNLSTVLNTGIPPAPPTQY